MGDTKATDTYSKQAILYAIPWQQWLRERPSLSHLYAYRL